MKRIIIGLLRRKGSIRSKIFFSIVVFLIIPFLISFYYIDRPLEKVIEKKIGNSSQDALSLVNMNIEAVLQDMFKLSTDLSIDPDVIHLLKNPGKLGEYDQLEIKQSILHKLSFYNFTAYVAILDRQGNWISTRHAEPSKYEELTQTDWYQELTREPSKLIWFYSHNYTFADHSPVISLAKNVFDPLTHNPVGVLLFSVSEGDIGKYLSRLDGDTFILDKDGIVMSSPNKAVLGKLISQDLDNPGIWLEPKGQTIVEKHENKSIVNYSTFNQTGWKIVQAIPYDMVFKEIFDIRRANIAITIVIFILFILITITISYSISKPLKSLARKMLAFEEQSSESVFIVKGPKEISLLADTYNKMIRRINELMQRLKEQYQQKEELRFKALQAQINPHFILNTLNNIKWMAYIRNAREVGDMLSNLGGIMESAIGRGENLIPLRHELDYIRNYTALMKIKYNEKLTVDYDVPDELLSVQVVKFMLQPIIENCIQHGIEPLREKGVVKIRAEVEGSHMILTVQDNGVGMDRDKLRKIQGFLSSGSEVAQGERIGIKNVHDRIKLQYGASYGVTVESILGEGTKVRLSLPYQSMMEREESHGSL
ncbi:sensor histidine kinase [Paenibacillus sp. J2TS4]|uniref:sensor histidine kinase n=1 Tax=Paenibacillus sp. J2TS4 TaxID=2807194 RepID=UPI001B03F099|nr:sensor histidine kinase [Paenibacillus sp. J2TS4]GIP35720.1 sensor histidine kinase YesM [Paenibacillus sp. J2TS4]